MNKETKILVALCQCTDTLFTQKESTLVQALGMNVTATLNINGYDIELFDISTFQNKFNDEDYMLHGTSDFIRFVVYDISYTPVFYTKD